MGIVLQIAKLLLGFKKPLKPKKKRKPMLAAVGEVNMVLERHWFTGTSTTGKLYVDDGFECYTLEDPIQEEKIYGNTAIPYGEYKVKITYSPRFKKKLPLLLKVPGFKGVRIHPGNWAKDTEGCILVGDVKGSNYIGQSRRAFARLMKKLQDAKAINLSIIEGDGI